jgi:hypothetical protein
MREEIVVAFLEFREMVINPVDRIIPRDVHNLALGCYKTYPTRVYRI